MDPRLLRYYERELLHLREVGGEFADEFPKIAGRLGLDSFECADPYVERLLEGFAFLAARVQLKLDAQFPDFTQALLQVVYPHYLCPLPSMTVVQVQPDLGEGGLAEGFTLPRDSSLRSQLGANDETACEYRTSHDLTLWPLELISAEYFSRDVTTLDIPEIAGVQAGLRIRLRVTAGLRFDQLSLDRLPLFLRGTGDVPVRLHEQLLAHTRRVVIQPAERPAPWREVLGAGQLRPVGFSDDQALLPASPRSFEGYRLLREYFAFPQRFMFVEFQGLTRAVRRCRGQELDLIVLMDQSDPELEKAVDASNFVPFCTPAINLFPKKADRIQLSHSTFENHIVPDRTKPMDFEVFDVTHVMGYGSGMDDGQEFRPFYGLSDTLSDQQQAAFYTLHRTPRVYSTKQRKLGPRSGYVGSESYLSLVDSHETPYRHELKQVAVDTRCTNRDLPLHMPIGQGRTDFALQTNAPAEAVRCVAGPTRPRPSPVHVSGQLAWRLVSHLSLNYLSLLDQDSRRGATALREMLSLYADASDAVVARQIEGVRSIASAPVTRRIQTPGALTFGRGLQIAVTFDEASFEGASPFLLGAVLSDFFARYVSINSFTETTISTTDRGDIMRWPARIGKRHMV